MTPDVVNGLFETGGGILITLSILRLHKDKSVRGVHWAPVMFFALWGYWNLFYYPHLEQWVSFVGGTLVVTANTVWLGQMIYYIRKEQCERSERH